MRQPQGEAALGTQRVIHWQATAFPKSAQAPIALLNNIDEESLVVTILSFSVIQQFT